MFPAPGEGRGGSGRGGNGRGNRDGVGGRGQGRGDHNQNTRGRGRGNGRNWGHRGGRGFNNNGNAEGADADGGGEGNRGRNRREPFERKGPVFGFWRLYGYLTLPNDEVILSISKDSEDWKEFLKSKSVHPSTKENHLHLVMQILAEKISSETILVNHQTDICIPTIEEGFRNSIIQQCSNIIMAIDPQPRRYEDGSFTEVDKSPEKFLEHVLKFTQFMLKRMPQISIDFLSGVISSALGIATAKNFNTLKDQFQALIEDVKLVREKEEEKLALRSKFKNQMRIGLTDEEEKELHAMEPPEDFRDMQVIPTVQELLSKDEPFLRPNKKQGAYIDGNHYLDVQFRLLREDFVQPLKKGVQDFMKHRFEYLNKKKKIPLGTIRVYPNVEIVSVELVRDNTVYKIQLHEDNYTKIKWEKSKRLLTGSLLVFTSDYFKTAYFAVVASRNVDELKKGILSVIWEGEGPVWDHDDEYLMIECEVYFEAYRYTLQTLKDLELDNFRMAKFIIQASSDVGPPRYLEQAENLVSFELQNGRQKFVSPLMLNQWPTPAELALDENQFVAFQAALTKEFVIVQGPPGTGKTFLGIKIVETFLKNEEIWGSTGPILVVCYTNHALDQFLEEILEVYSKLNGGATDPPIVRVGGRCKSEKLDHFSLYNVSRRKQRTMPRSLWPNKNEILYEIDHCRNKRAAIMGAILALRDLQGIVDFERLSVWNQLSIEYPTELWKSMQSPSWFGMNESCFKSVNFEEENIIQRWFKIREVGRRTTKIVNSQKNPQEEEQADEDYEEDYDVDELLQDRLIDDIYAEAESKGPSDAGKLLTYINGLSINDLNKKIKLSSTNLFRLQSDPKAINRIENAARLEEEKRLAINWKKFLERLFQYYNSGQIELPDADVTKILAEIRASNAPEFIIKRAGMSCRWALFIMLVERARNLCANEAADVQKEMAKCQKKLNEIKRFEDGYILQNSKIVGMTTTGAAKYNDLVKMMKSKIVIVEEAAEVLEAHIVTCITSHCEHLILIGDHRQLRPSTTVYDLAKKFNLDISLFERMINNKLNCYQLKVQHRMRPEIANLVVCTIYEELHNYPNVYRYPNVMGLKKNLFFISHQELEKSDSDSMSKSNMYEAKFLAGFCRHLMLQGYEPTQVTVLTTYTGQMFLLKKTIGEIANCRGIRVTCVDNFQGEENDIILLSLVRSNEQSKIGFLNIENRICVAVSRARHGLYIIGNMNMLSRKSKTWSQINEKLEGRGEIGAQLTLECKVHETETRIQSGNDFNLNAPEGGCRLICNAFLECTHRCEKVCHIKDQEHKSYVCKLPCLKSCDQNHPCKFPCFRKKCPPCTEIITKVLPQCQHEKQMQCYVNPAEVICQIPMNKSLACGHQDILKCYLNPSDYVCKVKMDRKLLCGHDRSLPCHVDPLVQICKEIVEKELPCLHKQMSECRFHVEVIKCLTIVDKLLQDCKHTMPVRCSEQDKPINCKRQCDIRLQCGHACTKVCHLPNDAQHLLYECKKDCARKCPEGHDCIVRHKCNTDCPKCMVEVSKKLPCLHEKILPCNIDISQYECLEECEKILNCRHKCQNLCFQDCGPCQIEVKKRIHDCSHIISVECSIRPNKDFCLTPVKSTKRAICGHYVMAPCRISETATPQELMEICDDPCSTLFVKEEGGCGHECQGTCGTCLQGRLHAKCQNKCGKSLVCSHICDFPCAQSCPSCDKQCVMKCEHSECRQKCGTPCEDCKEPCPWKCPHKSCNQLCREQCDREPCDEPCPQMLDCGHPCIGFCGEPCPPQCRICDRTHLVEEFILYGNEGDEDARFVFLPDCKHSIEVEGLTYHMNLSNDGEIGMKRCPRCQTVIRHCRRFKNVIRQRLQDVIDVKKIAFGNQEKVAKTQNENIQKLRWDTDMKWSRHFQILHEFLIDKIVEIVPVKRGDKNGRWIKKKVDEWTMTSINFLVTSAESAIDILSKSRQAEMRPELLGFLHAEYRKLFSNIQERHLPLSRIEMRDANCELERLFDLNQIFLRRSNPRFTDGHTRAIPIYEKLLGIVNSNRPFSLTHKTQIRVLLNQLEDILQTGLGISEMERKEIIGALNLAQGRWFKCPNGHPFVITECGGAMQVGKCNECGAPIGGQNHQMLRGNQLAPEMDGARAPLWPTALDH